jgi:hypothetical protein
MTDHFCKNGIANVKPFGHVPVFRGKYKQHDEAKQFTHKLEHTDVSKSKRKTSPTRIIFLVRGCFSVVPPTIIIELLTTTHANSMWESGFGIGDSCLHLAPLSSIYTSPYTTCETIVNLRD